MRKVKLTRREYREEYLNSDEWKKIRLRILEREKWKCQRCGATAKDVHHRKYDFVSIRPDNILMALCRDCHNLAHKAIECRVLPKSHSEKMLKCITEEKIKKANKKLEVGEDIIDSILAGTLHGIKLACGILKISEGKMRDKPKGLKVSRDKMDHLKWIIKTKPTHSKRIIAK